LKGPDGRSKGIAFVRFNDEATLNNALEYNGSEHMGRYLVIEKTKAREGGGTKSASNDIDPNDPNATTCFIGNLNF